MKKIPLFGSGIKSYSQVVTAQRRLNCFYDKRTDGDKNQYILRGTPGTVLAFVMLAGTVRGWRVYGGVLYVVAGPVLYSISVLSGVYTATALGSITSQTGFVSMADNGVQLILVDGVAGYILTFSGLTFATITDSNFPNGATTVDFLDGWFVVEAPGSLDFYICNSYNGATWTPPVFAAKENSSDYLQAVNVVSGILILWGASTTEFWQDTGGSPMPYQRINGATASWGLAAKWSRATVVVPSTGLASMIALGISINGTAQVIMLVNGYTPVRISDSDVENIINSFSTYSDATALTYMIDGHLMYQLTFPTGGRTVVYDLLSQQWFEAQTGLGLTGRHYGNISIPWNGQTYVSDYSSRNVYVFSNTNYADNGANIKRQVVSRHLVNGGAPFSLDDLYLDMETGVGTQVGAGSNPKIMLQVSKDGGRTFGYERWKSLGMQGQYYSPRVLWNRLGQAKDFVFQVTMTDPVKFTLTAAYASSIDPGEFNG